MALIFVKLGGSIITDTKKENTPLPAEISRLVCEIRDGGDGSKIILGHGSGSFGHVAAHRYELQKGLHREDSAIGAAITRKVAANLNSYVIDSMLDNGMNALSFPPSAGGITSNKRIVDWNIEPIKRALDHGFIPVVMGDVAIDTEKGIAVIPTEEPFRYLAEKLRPDKVIVASDIDGVFTADPHMDKDARLVGLITRENYEEALSHTGSSLKVDVTGGMRSKLAYLYDISEKYGATCQIVNATVPGRLRDAVAGREVIGTVIKA